MKIIFLIIGVLSFSNFNNLLAQTSEAPKLFAGSASKMLPVRAGEVIGAWGQKGIQFVLYDDLKSTALVLTNGKKENGVIKKIAIVTVDLLLIYNGGVEGQPNFVDRIEGKVNEILNRKGESIKVVIVATHSHASPDMKENYIAHYCKI